VAPRDAASVVLVRARPGTGTEVFMLPRRRSMAFAPGAYVFPGGGVDDSDADGGHGWAGPPPDQFAPALGVPPAAAPALIRASVRNPSRSAGGSRRGRAGAVPPTAVTLHELAAQPDMTAMLAARPWIEPRCPVVTVTGGQVWLVIPDAPASQPDAPVPGARAAGLRDGLDDD